MYTHHGKQVYEQIVRKLNWYVQRRNVASLQILSCILDIICEHVWRQPRAVARLITSSSLSPLRR